LIVRVGVCAKEILLQSAVRKKTARNLATDFCDKCIK
jgi:hypothetical protein